MKIAGPERTRLRWLVFGVVAALAAWFVGRVMPGGGAGSYVLIGLAAAALAAPLFGSFFARHVGRGALAVEVPVLLMLLSTTVLRVRTADALAANPLDSAGLFRVALVGLALLLGTFALLSPPLEGATWRYHLTTRPFRVYLVYIGVVMLGIPASVKPLLTAYRAVELIAGCVVLLGAYRALGNAAARRIEMTLYWFTAALVGTVWVGRFVSPAQALQRPLESGPLKWELVGVWPTLSSNSVGAFGVLLAIWSLARFMNSTRWDGRRSVALALTLLGVITTIGAQYRTGYAAVVAGALVVFWLRRRVLVVVLAAVALFVVLSTPSIISTAQPYVLRGQTTKEASTLTGRTNYWSHAVRVWEESPVIGRGLWTASRYEVLEPLGLTDTASVHSTWVEALVGTGILGLTLLVTCVLMNVRRAWRAAHVSPYVVGPLALMTALIIRSLTGNLFESFGHEQLIFLAIMLTLEDLPIPRRPRDNGARPTALGAQYVPTRQVRVLVAHSRYLSGVASGENQVVDDEIRLLERAGHEVRRWEPSPDTSGVVSLLRAGVGTVWSVPAVRQLRLLLDETRAEVLHCHNLFPSLSPAVLRVAEQQGVAVVMTLHNYRLLCLPADFLRDDRVCEDCLGHVPWRGVVHRCYRNSASGSTALAASLTLHRKFRTFDKPELFLAVSEFVRAKHVASGMPADRIRVKSNFAWPCARRPGAGEYFLFVGRLSREKGVEPLLRAWKDVDARLVVVGDGPDREKLHEIAPSSVEFAGALPRDDVDRWLLGARALVVPSICYEGQPRTILEAFAAGVPVIASRMGGLPELVLDGVSGRVVDPHEPGEWHDAVDAMQDDDEVRRLGDGAFAQWSAHYSPEIAVDALDHAYRDALRRA